MIIKHKLLASTALIGALLIAGTAQAQQNQGQHGRPGHHGRYVAKADANKDQALSHDEVIAAENKRFDRIDANHDGKIAKDEFVNPRGKANNKGQRREAAFNKVDANHDGAISKDEWMAGVEKRFTAHDRNSDGKVSKGDKQQAKRAHRPVRGAPVGSEEKAE